MSASIYLTSQNSGITIYLFDIVSPAYKMYSNTVIFSVYCHISFSGKHSVFIYLIILIIDTTKYFFFV